jgi:transcriptional regulator with AAA-type ATPase domain/tetratricopeptide (TPR) repeat protein
MAPLLEIFRGKSPRIEAIRRQVTRLMARPGDARRVPPILILGETGTGKGLLARAIHQAGPRRAGPFVDINCAAIPETLLEAELFGYERGAFTDARSTKAGLIQTAHGGTVFFDEIGLLPAALQGKLLTVLEDSVVRRLGSTHAERVDVAMLAATSVDLRRAVADGRFREDLYHRLAVITLDLPPLRLRGPDILTLADQFLARACLDYGLSPRVLTPEARAVLTAHSWPGNVRELANAMERVALLSDGDEITEGMLDFLTPGTVEGAGVEAVGDQSLEDAVRTRIEGALRASGGNIRRTAAALGISRNTLRARMDRYGLRHRDRALPTGRPSSLESMPAAAPWASPEWQSRRLAFLRVRLMTSSPGEGPLALEVAGDKVRAFGGRIEESGPTGVIAVFGLEPVDNAPCHAALAAVAMRNTMAQHRVDAVFAIHCADHLVGHDDATPLIGMDGKAATWLLLETLVRVDSPGAILVSGPVAPFLARRFSLERALNGEFNAWRVLGLDDGPSGWKATRFVGRAGELGVLRRAASLAERGHGQIVGVVGEAGVGKSRLVREATNGLQGWRLLSAGGAPYTKEMPCAPLIELLEGLCRIQPTDAATEVGERIARALRTDAEARLVLPPILDLLGALPVDHPFRNADPAQRRQRTSEAVRQILLAASRVQPLCLVIDDLHWIDAETQENLDGLVNGLVASRVLLVVIYRPEYRHAWSSKTFYSQVSLDALPVESAGELLNALLGPDPGLAPLKKLLVGQGNPFFLEETVRMLVETDVLAGERGRYQLMHSVDAVSVPPTVQAMLAARIDRLPSEDRHLLQVASVIGRDVPFPLLQAIADVPDEAIHRGLDRLQAAEFLYETQVPPDPEYAFKHALTHEVTYGTLPLDRRQALHARIVDAIERVNPERLAGADELLAYHALRGEMWEKAVMCLRQAGARAVARSANREAVRCFEQALAALQHLPESRRTLEQAVDLRFDLRTALFPLGESERIFDYLGESERLVETLGDQRRLGQLCAYLCQDYWTSGHPTKAREFGQRALAIAESLQEVPLQVTASLYLSAALIHTGDSRQAETLLLGVLRLLGHRDRERFGLVGFPAVSARFYLTWIALSRGDFEEGIARVEEGIRLAEELDHPYTLGAARSMLAFLHMVRGELDHAISFLERELAMPPEGSVAQHSVVNWGHLGYAYTLSGRTAEGIPLQERALKVIETIRLGAYQPTCMIQLGEAYLLAGRVQDGLEQALRALAFTRERGQCPHEAWALRLLGEVTTHADPERAGAYYHQALARAEELEMRHLVAHCHLGLGRLHKHTGKPAQARAHLWTAAAMFREMGMRFWVERSEAAIP